MSSQYTFAFLIKTLVTGQNYQTPNFKIPRNPYNWCPWKFNLIFNLTKATTIQREMRHDFQSAQQVLYMWCSLTSRTRQCTGDLRCRWIPWYMRSWMQSFSMICNNKRDAMTAWARRQWVQSSLICSSSISWGRKPGSSHQSFSIISAHLGIPLTFTYQREHLAFSCLTWWDVNLGWLAGPAPPYLEAHASKAGLNNRRRLDLL